MQNFIMMCGLPGSLKSTYAKWLAKDRYKDAEIISSDAIRKEKGYKQGEIADVFSIVNHRIMNSPHETVIYDATNLQRKYRVALLKNIDAKFGYLVNTELIFMSIPIKICKYLNEQRSGFDKVPDYVYDRMLRHFDIPMYNEGWNVLEYANIFVLGRTSIIDPHLFYDDRRLSLKYSSFSIEDMDFDQDNPHHTLSLKEHCNKCFEYVKNNDKYFSEYYRTVIEQAALFHDIGKILTKDYHDAKGNPSETAHYYGHENVGAYLAATGELDRYIDVSGYTIAEFIAFHMKASFSWRRNPYGKRTIEEKKYFSVNDLMLLELLGEGDRQAH